VTAVPEPSTFAIISGVLALGFVMLRRRLMA
ncbi:MAG: PEP-CTERM sorting domain-containing protein, partial [Oceanipulchritudo sp.]